METLQFSVVTVVLCRVVGELFSEKVFAQCIKMV